MANNSTGATPAPEWRVKYDGACSRCGLPLLAGDIAVYERPTRSIRCVTCPGETGDQPAEPSFDPGVAGASARREYERRKSNRERRIRGRYGRFGGAVLALTDDPPSTRAWAIGARGEEKLANALQGIEGLRALHDRRVPGARGNIDHIVVAPAGVFVIDAKNYEGRIEIRNGGWFLRPDHRLYVGRRDCSSLATGLGWQVEAVMSALIDVSIDRRPSVTPVLCFVDGEWPLFSAPDVYAGVRLESPRSIRKLVTAPDVLDPPSIDHVAQLLGIALPAR